MKGPELLKHYEDNWQTDMGAWFPGERVVLRGKDVFTELNNHTWMEYLVYAVTGKEAPKIARLMEALWSITTSYPDPRLWNNRIAALAGTTRSTGVLAAAAGSAISEAKIYGLRTSKGALDFLRRATNKVQAGIALEEIVKDELKQYRVVYGYGRPLVQGDERVKPLIAFAKSIGAGNGTLLKLAFEIENYFQNSRYKYQINIAAIAAALVGDEGLTADEFYHLASMSFIAGITPCYIDSLSKCEGCFYPINSTRISYIGKKYSRQWKQLNEKGAL